MQLNLGLCHFVLGEYAPARQVRTSRYLQPVAVSARRPGRERMLEIQCQSSIDEAALSVEETVKPASTLLRTVLK